MKIDLKKLNGVYGGKIPFSGEADLSGEELYGAYPFRQPVRYEGEIANHLGVLTLSGTIRAVYATCCARCLKPLDVPLAAQVETVLSRDGSEEDDVFVLTEDAIEVEDVLIPELLLQVHMTYLCREDCKGLCPVCGADRNVQPCTCENRQVDPRLAALAALLDGKTD